MPYKEMHNQTEPCDIIRRITGKNIKSIKKSVHIAYKHMVLPIIPRFCNSGILHCRVNELVTIVLFSIAVQYNFISE